jgi:hypothetical protein
VSLNIEVPYNQGAGLYLPLTGGALTGPLALGANKITGLANGTAATDAATFGQVQTTEAALNPALQYNDLLGWTFDLTAIVGADTNTVPTAAYVFCGRIPLPGVMTVTNVIIAISVLGLTLTHSFLALFKSDGTVIGQSADQSTAWGSLGSAQIYTLPLVGGPFVCMPLAANDFLYAAIYIGTFVTAPTIYNAGSNILESLTPAPRARAGKVAQANTATLTNINPAALTNFSNYLPWFGIS